MSTGRSARSSCLTDHRYSVRPRPSPGSLGSPGREEISPADGRRPVRQLWPFGTARRLGAADQREQTPCTTDESPRPHEHMPARTVVGRDVRGLSPAFRSTGNRPVDRHAECRCRPRRELKQSRLDKRRPIPFAPGVARRPPPARDVRVVAGEPGPRNGMTLRFLGAALADQQADPSRPDPINPNMSGSM